MERLGGVDDGLDPQPPGGTGREAEEFAGDDIEEPVVTGVLDEDSGGFIPEEPQLMRDPRVILRTLAIVIAVTVAIYIFLPKLLDLDDALAKLGQGDRAWLGAALGFGLAMFVAYVALFRGVVGERVVHLEWQESYEITMAGLAATRLFSAGGAGGIILTYWALRKAGLGRSESARRMTAFLVLQYAVYMLSLIAFGVLLRTGAVSGEAPLALTVIPAALAGAVMVIFLGLTFVPHDLVDRVQAQGQGRVARLLRQAAKVPEVMGAGTRTAIDYLRHPSRGSIAVLGAVGFWAANIGILWASFHAYDVEVPLGVVIQGFFVGMVANLFPFAPGGVGAVDAGLIGTFVLFGLPESEVFAAVLSYRVIAFWAPIPPGVVAYFQLRRTIERWDAERREADLAPGPHAEASRNVHAVAPD